jgi:hypothetical protein
MCCKLCQQVGWLAALFILRRVGFTLHLFCRLIFTLSSFSMSGNLFIPPTKQSLSLEKCIFKSMYMSGLFSKIHRILLLSPTRIFSISKINCFPVFNKRFSYWQPLPMKGNTGEKFQGKNLLRINKIIYSFFCFLLLHKAITIRNLFPFSKIWGSVCSGISS